MNTLPFPTSSTLSITRIIGLIGLNSFIYGLISSLEERYIIIIAAFIMMSIGLLQEANTRKEINRNKKLIKKWYSPKRYYH